MSTRSDVLRAQPTTMHRRNSAGERVAWCKLPANWNREPRYHALIGSLGEGAATLPPTLWAFCAQNVPSGNLCEFSDETLAAELRYHGNPVSMSVALVECGYLTPARRVVGWHFLFSLARKYSALGRAGGLESGRARRPRPPPSDSSIRPKKKKELESERRGEVEVQPEVEPEVRSRTHPRTDICSQISEDELQKVAAEFCTNLDGVREAWRVHRQNRETYDKAPADYDTLCAFMRSKDGKAMKAKASSAVKVETVGPPNWQEFVRRNMPPPLANTGSNWVEAEKRDSEIKALKDAIARDEWQLLPPSWQKRFLAAAKSAAR